MTVPDGIIDVLESAERVLVTSHVPPDGDGFGSGIALVRLLRGRGATAVFAVGGSVQENISFLAKPDELDRTPAGPFDAAIALDSGSFARLGGLGPRCRECEHFLNIDHHGSNELYGTVNWVDPSAPATGEMIFRLLKSVGEELTRDLGLPLYVALVTDTGRFSYSNSTPAAHLMAAELLSAGVDPVEATDRIYRSLAPGYLKLWGMGIDALEVTAKGRVAHLTVTEEMVRISGADVRDLGDLVDLTMSLAGVEVGVLFRDRPDGPGTKLSLRSRRWFSVSDLAGRFGGGGHPRASGAVLPEPPEEARAIVLAAIEEALGDGGGES